MHFIAETSCVELQYFKSSYHTLGIAVTILVIVLRAPLVWVFFNARVIMSITFRTVVMSSLVIPVVSNRRNVAAVI